MVTHGRIQPVRLFDEEDEEDEEEEEEEEKEGPLGQLGHARALLVDLHRYGRGLDRHALEGIVGPQLSEHLGEIWDPFAVLGPSRFVREELGEQELEHHMDQVMRWLSFFVRTLTSASRRASVAMVTWIGWGFPWRWRGWS